MSEIAMGMIAVIIVIIGVGVYSGRHVKNASDFLTGGGRVGSLMTCGAFVSTVVGSQVTLGTAQMAFDYGVVTLWFTLGVALGCVLLGLFFAKRLRNVSRITQFQIIADEYGQTAGSLSSVVCITGIAVSLLSQVLACVGLVAVLFPSMPAYITAILSAFIMCAYVLFGGVLGMGMGGLVKMLLLYLCCLTGMWLALSWGGGLSGLFVGVKNMLMGTAIGDVQTTVGFPAINTEREFSARFLNMFQHGTGDVISCLCTALGMISTQIYVQFLKSARDTKTARDGALLGGLSILPVALACACIGLFMRGHSITQAEADALLATGQTLPDLPIIGSSLQAFPAFVLHYLPPFAAGIVLGTLLITIISGAAGLLLGIAAVIVKDIIGVITRRFSDSKRELFLSRLVIVVVIAIAMPVGLSMSGWALNELGFLSMVLRATVVFVPFVCALWFPSRIAPRAAIVSIILGPITVILTNTLDLPVNSMLLGMIVAALCCLLGAFVKK